MADLSVKALKLHDNEQEPLAGMNCSISVELTEKWFGEEVLIEGDEGGVGDERACARYESDVS
jgi:hypothetical protein